jgi:peptidylprolyl isomerase
MGKAKKGDTVKVHYTGTLGDGTVFDSSREREPLEFKLGEKMLIPGFEAAVEGMEKGNTRTVSISPEDAYGERSDELVMVIGREEFPENIDPKVGLALTARHPEAGVIETVITEVTDEKVTIDANHPLAGQELTFEIELVEIGA